MRLLMYLHEGRPRPAVLVDEALVDLDGLSAVARLDSFPSSLLELIRQPDAVQRLRGTLASIGGEVLARVGRPLSSVEVVAPLDPPSGNVVAIGRNYAEHAAEIARARGIEIDRPTVFTKAQTSVTGPYAEVRIPALSSEVDWEAELAVVIGRKAVDVPRELALDYVFGYTVINDVSARDVQYGWGGQFYRGKSFDTFCPMGPWIVTADEVPDPQDLEVRLQVNGETKQEASTRDMIFPVAELIAQLSGGMTLLPGTVIATGTPAGVGQGREPKEFLKAGDVMETEVVGVGTLRNRIA